MLDFVRGVIVEEFEDSVRLATAEWKKKGRLVSIILYGSHARGTWVDDPVSGYQSDFDILVIVSSQRLKDNDDLWYALDNRLMHHPRLSDLTVNIIVHTLAEVNEALSLGRYFFVDIYRDGIALYGENTKLKEPGPLCPEDAVVMAEEYSTYWLDNAESFVRVAKFLIEEKSARLNIPAFHLHQATESLYGAFLLTRTNYMPQTHNLGKLRSFSESLDARLIPVWPRATRAERKPFKKLIDAYVKARYSPRYRIEREMLEGLMERVAELHGVVETACQERLDELRKAVKQPPAS